MEEILASIRRIIAEDEAGRVRSGAVPPPRSLPESPSRAPQITARTPPPAIAPPAIAPPAVAPLQPPQPEPQAFSPRPVQTGDLVLDLTNMVAADGSVVTIAPTFPHEDRRSPPKAQSFASPAAEHETVPYGGFPRRVPPPPGPGAEPRQQPPAAPPPAAASDFAPPPESGSTDTPSRRVRGAGAPAPLPPLSEDSPSRRVFKRRHTAGSAFAELAQSGFTPGAAESGAGYGKVPVGAVATELDMNPPPPPAARAAEPTPFPPDQGFGAPQAAFAGRPPAPPVPSALSEDQVRQMVSEMAEPALRAWLDANLAPMVERQVAGLVQARIDEAVNTTLTALVDQQIHQNVEANLGPYIEDRVGAHVDARLAPAVDEKVGASVKREVAEAVAQAVEQHVADTVSQHVAHAVDEHVTQAVTSQLQTQQQNLARVVDERVKGEIRSIFQRLAGN